MRLHEDVHVPNAYEYQTALLESLQEPPVQMCVSSGLVSTQLEADDARVLSERIQVTTRLFKHALEHVENGVVCHE